MPKLKFSSKVKVSFFRFIDIVGKPNPQLSDSINTKWLRITITILGYVAALLTPLAAYLTAEYFAFGVTDHLREMVSTKMPQVAFGLIITYILFALLWMLFRRAWIAGLVQLFVYDGLAVASFFKVASTGEYVYPWDLQQITNLGLLSGYTDGIALPKKFFIVFAILVVLVLFLAFSKPAVPIRFPFRLLIIALACFLLYNAYGTSAKLSALIGKYNMTFTDAALQESNYIANGFVDAFTLNLFSGIIETPEDYSEEAIDSIMKNYQPKAASESFNKPNIILVLCESFYDITQIDGLNFSADPLAEYRELCKLDNAYSGKFYTTGFGGGTVRPEFEVLTGLSADDLPSGCVPWQYIDSDFDTYASQMKNEYGYHTTMVHPYLNNFYMREAKYPFLGFDETWFDSDLHWLRDVERVYGGGQVSDHTLMQYLEYFLNKSPERDFIFGISMEGHIPYPNRYSEDEIKINVTCDSPEMDADTLHIINQYAQCVNSMDKAMKELVDYVNSLNEPTVVVLFGDHAPSLGSNYAGYYKSGFTTPEEIGTPEVKDKLQSTPFLVYANFPLDENNGMLRKGSDNKITSYNLMNAVFRMIGAPVTERMGFLYDYYKTVPNYNNRMNMTVTDEIKYFANAHKLLTFDLLRGESYSVPEKAE